MITLLKDSEFGRELVTVRNWSELRSLPGYTDALDPRRHKLAQVIGSYSFEDRQPCGLCICRQPHGNGYIVTTVTGPLTNLGKDCGKKYFGDLDWVREKKRFEVAAAALQNRETLRLFSVRLPNYEERIEALQNGKPVIGWINDRSNALRVPNRGVPLSVVDRVTSMRRRRDSRVTRVRAKTAAELAMTRDNERFLEEPIGEIRGFELLYEENNLQKLFAIEVIEGLKKFKQVDLDALSTTDLKRLARWADSFEPNLSKVETLREIGCALLTADNLRILGGVIGNTKERSMFAQFLKSLTPTT